MNRLGSSSLEVACLWVAPGARDEVRVSVVVDPDQSAESCVNRVSTGLSTGTTSRITWTGCSAAFEAAADMRPRYRDSIRSLSMLPGTFRTSAWSSTRLGDTFMRDVCQTASVTWPRRVSVQRRQRSIASFTWISALRTRSRPQCNPQVSIADRYTHRSTRHQRRGPRAWRASESRTGDLAAWRGCPAIERYTEPHLAASGSIGEGGRCS